MVRYHMILRRILCTQYNKEILTAVYVPSSVVWRLITICKRRLRSKTDVGIDYSKHK